MTPEAKETRRSVPVPPGPQSHTSRVLPDEDGELVQPARQPASLLGNGDDLVACCGPALLLGTLKKAAEDAMSELVCVTGVRILKDTATVPPRLRRCRVGPGGFPHVIASVSDLLHEPLRQNSGSLQTLSLSLGTASVDADQVDCAHREGDTRQVQGFHMGP